MSCPFLKAGNCQIATDLVGRPAVANSSACAYCTNTAEPPQAVNGVTVSLAIVTLRDDATALADFSRRYGQWLRKESPNQQRFAIVQAGMGPGSELWRLLQELGIRHTADCACLTWAERMNSWGPEGCRLSRDQIVAHMRTSAWKYGWGDVAAAAVLAVAFGLAWRINLLDPYGSLVDEAIRRSEQSNG